MFYKVQVTREKWGERQTKIEQTIKVESDQELDSWAEYLLGSSSAKRVKFIKVEG